MGSVLKKMIEINPELPAPKLIDILKQSISTQGQYNRRGEIAQAEVIDELKALRMTWETLKQERKLGSLK